MATAINLTPGDGPTTFLLNVSDTGVATSLSGENASPDSAARCEVVGWGAEGTADPSKSTVLILAPGQSGQTVIPPGKSFSIVTNARGRLAGFDTTIS